MHNLLARCRPRSCLGFLVALIFAGVAVAETSIPISNSSFEDPALAPDGYTYVLPGWTNPGATVSAFIERITGVTAADGLNYLGLELNGVVYQDLGVTYAANTLYRLRVAAGHRLGWTAPGNVATYALTDNTGSPIVVSASTNAYNIAAGTFAEAPALYVNTAVTPALVGRTIRVRLSAGGDGRSQFDQVRLDSGPFSLVTTTNDSGPGSLRQVVLDAVPGDTVLFATNLSGATVLLTGGQIVLDKNLTIDASALPLGFRLDGAQLNRIFNVVGGVAVTLNALAITNGYADLGGAINNAGTLTLNQSTLAGNAASVSGGAIENNGSLILNRSTLAGNSAVYGGGAIDNNSALTMNQCSLSGNLAPNNGGAIWAGGTVQLNNCTVVGNSTTVGTGGGIDRYGSATIVLTNSIVANNSAPVGPNINGLFTGINNLTEGDPLLAPLGDYGGPTPTMPPLFGSPALDAGSDSVTNLLFVDQRGLARRSGVRVDLGAVEVQVLVVTNSADSGPGSLREIVGQAPASSAVLFAPALSGQTILLTSGQIFLDRNVSIDGSSLPGGIRLDGNGADRVFWINGGASVVLTALTITNGNGGSYYGGGLINFGTLTLNRCTLAGNTAYLGGGLLNWDQTLTVNQCTFTENSAQDSGGGLFNYVGTLHVIQSTVVGNVSGNAVFDGGGGVQSYAGPLALTNSIVAGNTATLNENVGFFAGLFTAASNFTNGSPLLAPLGHYGGPTPTMPPQAASPVVDAAPGSVFTIDQRGAPRLLGSAADLGAVEANLVTTAADGVAGSLRSALSNAIPHDWITFAPALSGATLTLTGGQLLLNKSLAIDASALPGGFTLNGNQASRIFQVNSGATNVLANLTLTRGNGVGATASGSGGAILNSGTLTLNQCTLSSNAAASTGGAILNQAPLSANGCTFSTNTAPTNGGAVANGIGGSASFTNCTFFNNAHTGASQGGGALNHAAVATRMTLVHCTIAGNSATGSDGGGGIRNRGPLFTLANCIVGSNTISAGLGADLNNNSALIMLGVNVVPALANVNAGTVTGSGTNLALAPLLAAPGKYGGPTQTMPPLAGSPAMDAGLDAVAAGLATDQRGFVRFVGAHVDIGAVEAATTNNAFAHRAVISGASVTVGGANLNASTEPGEPVHAWNSGGRSVWWTWTATSDGAVTIDTIGSSFDTLLAVYQGTSLGALTLVAANDDIGDGSSQSRVTFNVSAGLTYQIAVDGYNGAGGSIVLNLVQTFGSVYGAANGITTLAGRPDTGSADGPGGLAVFNNPYGIVLDRGGNAYVVDQLNHTIRKVTPVGVVTTIAGVAGQYGLADGVGPNARFFGPAFIAMDSATNLYVSDIGNHSIRKLTPSGTNWVVTTLAGRPWPYPPGNVDGTNFDARLMDPQGIALGAGGNLFVADAATHTIRKLSPSGTNWIVTTIAGLAFQNGTVDGTGTNARFNGPLGLAIDSGGNLYVTERDGYVVRKLAPSGQDWVVTTIAGSGTHGYADGTNSNAQFTRLFGITVDSRGVLFVADADSATIRKLTPVGLSWVVTTFAGGDPNRYASADGTGGNAWFESPNGVAFDTAGNLYVTDPNSIRKITTAAVVTTLAGVVIGSTSDDDTGVFAGFYRPYGVAVELSGNNVYVSDSENHTIRKITSVGGVSTIAGLVGNPGFADGPGDNARFNLPYGLVVDGAGNIFVADSGNNRIRKVTAAGVVSTWAGSGAWGFGDGPASGAQFRSPSGLALDGSGNLFVADTWNHAIRKITAAGNVSTIAGTGSPGTNDGPGASAQFFSPTALALDKAGNLFVADTDNHTIRRITPAGVVSTIAGTAGVRVDGLVGRSDGPGLDPDVLFWLPSGLAVDGAGRVYVADRVTSTIRQLTQEGDNWMVKKIAGDFFAAGFADGIGRDAQFNYPRGIALDGAGVMYVADTDNNLIRKGVFTSYAPSLAVAYTPPAATGRITVTLTPPEANGQWRFPWEQGWHGSGFTASNLAAGNYEIEFRNQPGWVVLPLGGPVTLSSGAAIAITNEYYPTVGEGDPGATPGALSVFLGATPPAGAGWRFVGDNTGYLPNGFTTNLVPGTYFVEFAAVSGRIKPSSQAVHVNAGQPSYLSVNYLLAAAPPANVALPQQVPSHLVGDESSWPFGFNGQLQSDTGYGSGVAVQKNVVLTAAHLVFNDQTLSYVSRAYWLFRRHAGVSEPLPMEARGFYVLSGYAAQRTNDLFSGSAPGQSTPPSRNLDVAALYFNQPVAGGGYGGYLPSDTVPNNWLASSAAKMLVGYPVDGSQFGDAGIVPGRMYQTAPQSSPLSLATDPVLGQQQVYVAPWFLSYPGNSGGPLYVQLNGYYYPAAVYIGTLFSGAQPYASVVRAIDTSVANLITLASSQGDSGTNNTGGGVITIVPSQAVSAGNPGYVQFRLTPPAAVRAGAAWRLLGDTAYSTSTNYTRAVTSTNSFAVEFKPVPGWNVPASQSVFVAPGVLITNTAFYTVTNPVLSQRRLTGSERLGMTGTTGTVYRLERRSALTNAAWLPVTTNTIRTNGFNPVLTNPPAGFYRLQWLP